MADDANKPEKILYMVTKGREDAEMALLPFMHAVGAQSMDVEAVVVVMANGVNLVKKGYAAGIALPHMPPLTELLDNFLKLGGRILVCGPCIKSRAIAEDDLIEGAKVVGAATLTEEALSADAVMNY